MESELTKAESKVESNAELELTKAEFIYYLNCSVDDDPTQKVTDQDDSKKVGRVLTHKLLLLIHPDKCITKDKPCIIELFNKINGSTPEKCTKLTRIFRDAFKKYFTNNTLENVSENNWESNILDLSLTAIFNLYLACKRLNNKQITSTGPTKLITGGANINVFSLLVVFISYFLIMKTLMVIDKGSSYLLKEIGEQVNNNNISSASDILIILDEKIGLIHDTKKSENTITEHSIEVVRSLFESDITGIPLPSFIIPAGIMETLNNAYKTIGKINELKNSGEAEEAEKAIEDTKITTMNLVNYIHEIIDPIIGAKDKIKMMTGLKNREDDNKKMSYSKQVATNTIKSYKISELLTLLKPILQSFPELAAYQIIFISLDHLTNVFWFEEKLDNYLDIAKFVDDILQLVIYCKDNYMFDRQQNTIKDNIDIDQSSLSTNSYTNNEIVKLLIEILPENKNEIIRDFSGSNMLNNNSIRNRANKLLNQAINDFNSITINEENIENVINMTIQDFPKQDNNLDIKSFLNNLYNNIYIKLIKNGTGDKNMLTGGRTRKSNKNKSKTNKRKNKNKNKNKSKNKNKRKNTFKRRK